MRRDEKDYTARYVIGGIASFIMLVVIWMGVHPQYRVWQQGLAGEAALKKAEQTRKIAVEAARAERDSAQLRADAIAIVGQAAKDFPEYRQQEFIGAFAEAMHNGTITQIIYVPTEGNIPLLEAGLRHGKEQ